MTDERGDRMDMYWLLKRLATKGADWAILGLLGLILVLVVNPIRDRALAIWNTPAVMNLLADKQAEILDLIGANRVIDQPPGQSFVREPVRQGETLVFVLTVRRTNVGASCRYIEAVPLFTDETGATSAGTFYGAGRQYGTSMERTEMRIEMPEALAAGRTTLQMQLHYRCGGEDVFELTYPVVFTVLPEE